MRTEAEITHAIAMVAAAILTDEREGQKPEMPEELRTALRGAIWGMRWVMKAKETEGLDHLVQNMKAIIEPHALDLMKAVTEVYQKAVDKKHNEQNKQPDGGFSE